MAGFGVFFPILPQYGLAIGASATEIGFAIAAFSLGQLLAGSLVGRLSDRLGRRRVLLWSLALTALTAALSALCTTPWSLIAVRLVGGLAAASFGVTFAVASDVSSPRDRAGAMAQVGAGLSLGFILGPALGGLMAGPTAEAADFAHICLASAALAAVAWAATLWLLPETGGQPQNAVLLASQATTQNPSPALQAPVASAPAPGVKLLHDPAVLRLLLVTLLAGAAAAMMEANYALFAATALGVGPRTIGFVFGAMGIISTVLQLAVAGWACRRFGDEHVMQAGLSLQALGLGLLAAASGFNLALAGMLTIAVGFAFLTPALSALTSLAGPDTAQGEVLGLQQAGGALGRVVGPASSGPLYDHYGANAPFLAGALAMLVTVIYARLTRHR